MVLTLKRNEGNFAKMSKYFFILVFLVSIFSITNVSSAASTYQQGIAVGSPTNVYEQTNTNSKVLKGYSQGTILKYKEANLDQWYATTVYLNGKATNGFIKKSDVESIQNSQQLLKGIALKSPTYVYTKASTASKPLKSYSQGTILKYYTYTSSWYKTTVYIKGIATSGYIHVNDVENIVTSQESISGIGLQSPTLVYSKASTDSTALKAYAVGTILRLKTFTSNWYEATVYIKGSLKIGYVKKSHIETIWSSNNQTLEGAALKNPTKVYSKASRTSTVLKSYTQSKILRYKLLFDHWYSTTVYISGVATPGYINRSDVQGVTYYDVTLDAATQMQAKVNPLTDESGAWKAANESQISYYLEPNNFLANATSSYQFLILSELAGTNATNLNNALLKDKGILSGRGSAFITAAQTYHVNEIYLISHALLETGNGQSTLSNGVKVSTVNGEPVEPKVVYNMFGIGAKDECAEQCGSEYAYTAGWTTPEKAIIGGAQFIGNGYVNAGQNTLYKMRWNPKGMEQYGYATHQYASDIGWAYKQTSRISEMYKALSTYSLKLDVATYLSK